MSNGISRRTLLAGVGASAAVVALKVLAAPNGRRSTLPTNKSRPRFALVIDQRKCASNEGCRACIDACHQEHSVPKVRDARHEVKWIWKDHFDALFPEQVHEYSPVARKRLPLVALCNHCSNPPCVKVCPTHATWRREDGVVAMDPHRCLGCRYCMVACPYGARSFNWEEPRRQNVNPNYPARSAGVVEKCTLCAERLDLGLIPTCVEVCRTKGTGAIVFGNLADPSSEVRTLLATRTAIRRKPELGTSPNVFYLL